ALSLPGAGPWRVFALNDPPRLIVDVAAGGWAGPRPAPPPDGLIAGLRAGMAEAGRARLALDLARPASLAEALMTPLPGGGARLRVILAPASSDEFAAASARGWPPGARASGGRSGFAADLRDAPDPRTPDRPLVMVDAGHGGFDPGAIRGEAVEKAIALDFARDLARALEDTGRWRAELTRDDDRYLGLDERVALAEAAGASVFLSIHANTVARGEALGASVFSLALRASDDETGALASSENRADIRAGAGHEEDGGPARGAGQGAGPGPDDIEAIVEAIGRGPATLASRSLADALAEDLGAVTPMLRGRAHAQARFRVLRSTRMASALVELGFLSAPEDLARMRDPGWRRLASQALAAGLDDWRAGAAARAYASAPGGRVAAAAD
ncbi:MAG: N-acetylmuramoyl-L-alanine amidase, partial [Pseudomonadota bacterium]|nr:N-acetylmuramoyl-L-alanine amidase [Pseudomonadota bacterium]